MLLSLIVLMGCGSSPTPETSERPEVGKWARVPEPEASTYDQLVAELEAIGYADGTQPTADRPLVPVHDASRMQPGLTLMSFGHTTDAVLVDADGTVVHRWCAPFSATFPGTFARLEDKVSASGINHWRRVHVDGDGSLFVVHEGRGIAKLAADSTVLWSRDNRAHHDLEVLPTGELAVLTRVPDKRPTLHADKPVLVDHIEILDPASGELKRVVPVLDALIGTPHLEAVLKGRPRSGNVLHSNAIRWIPDPAQTAIPVEQGPVWLVSMREPAHLMAVDATSETVVWSWKADFHMQHDPQFRPDGSFVLFDNRGLRNQHSRLLRYGGDPLTLQWTWPSEGGWAPPTSGASRSGACASWTTATCSRRSPSKGGCSS